MAKSMTIDEMRHLHQRALSDAEAKRTELRLVLASRYRELVGSSDEVLRMRERAQELHQLVHALPTLMAKLIQSKALPLDPKGDQEEKTDLSVDELRRDLARLPRIIHRALDRHDVHTAATSLIKLFGVIVTQTNAYKLANALAKVTPVVRPNPLDSKVLAQIKMTFLHVQTIPAKTVRLAKKILLRAAAQNDDSALGAHLSAAALSSLDMLNVQKPVDRAVPLLDLYFDSKAKLLQTLLGQLATHPSTPKENKAVVDTVGTEKAEQILSQIVSILQHDIILHPFQIFVKRSFLGAPADTIMKEMPSFDTDIVKSKASHFLAAHLPLIRTKVKSVLVTIAGTTASALGQIRQSLYDKTDGIECIQRLDNNGICTWEEAVNAMVDVRIVLNQGGPSLPDPKMTFRKFSLWSALFSNTFSSLVHSLLTTSFHSVHVRVVSTLRTSLANAPPFSAMLPHEAYRNTLKIATDLDAALLKVSEDAHELLVHAEERAESERRLRQSLYVQTCEIMGRLVCELRRMLLHKGGSDDATKEFLVGRLCHLLKFRLTALPTLLNPQHSPAVLQGASGGMITLLELESAFDLADDNEDGLITFEEAMEAVDSAFSGTPFHGGEMIRETLLLTKSEESTPSTPGGPNAAPSNVTLHELVLLSARGLRHEADGPKSALGTIQSSLNDIIESCLTGWAQVALTSATDGFSSGCVDFVTVASNTTELEWQRAYSVTDSEPLPDIKDYLERDDSEIQPVARPAVVGSVSPYVVGFMVSIAHVLNRSICPSDSLPPVPSAEYAAKLGLDIGGLQSMMETIRLALLKQALLSSSQVVEEHIVATGDGSNSKGLTGAAVSALVQLRLDVGFIQYCLFKRNEYGFEWRSDKGEAEEKSVRSSRKVIDKAVSVSDKLLRSAYRGSIQALTSSMQGKHHHVMEVSELFLNALLGGESSSSSSSTPSFGDLDVGTSSSAGPQVLNPLASSRRFGLLPIQSDRSLAELQRRGKFGKDKDEDQRRQDTSAGGVMSSGLGFFSSMLKKK